MASGLPGSGHLIGAAITAMERADEGSRDLDWKIAYALGLGTDAERVVYAELGPAGFTTKDADGFSPLDRKQGAYIKWSRPGREGRRMRIAGGARMYPVTGPQPLLGAPAYTTDLRAALLLVPDGHYWIAGHGRTRSDEPLGGFQVFDGEREVAAAEAPTVELACCIAALRAALPAALGGAA